MTESCLSWKKFNKSVRPKHGQSRNKIFILYNPFYLKLIITEKYIFHNSKINLNITLRSIKSGIPLRCLEIMACGGFLLTNFQSDFLRHFIPDEDFVFYESKEDLLQKIDYYLSHDAERTAIARSGYEKVSRHHNYDIIFEKIFDMIA